MINNNTAIPTPSFFRSSGTSLPQVSVKDTNKTQIVPPLKLSDINVATNRPVEIKSASSRNSLSTDTRRATGEVSSCRKKTCAGISAFFVASAGLILSPFTIVKFCVVALLQLCRGEFKRAGKALLLGITTPLWTPFLHAYHSYVEDKFDGDLFNWLTGQIKDAHEGFDCGGI
jgi:hypothetical protein